LPYVVALATLGVADAIARDPELASGVNTAGGAVTNAAVADALGRAPTAFTDALAR
jgi:alanine dehydrogenase